MGFKACIRPFLMPVGLASSSEMESSRIPAQSISSKLTIKLISGAALLPRSIFSTLTIRHITEIAVPYGYPVSDFTWNSESFHRSKRFRCPRIY